MAPGLSTIKKNYLPTWLGLRLLLLGFIGGIALAAWEISWLWVACTAAAAWVLTKHYRLAVLFVVAGIFLGTLRYPGAAVFTAMDVAYYADQQLTFDAVVVAPPDQRIKQTKFTVAAQPPYQGQVLVSAPLFSEFTYGDALRITCRLRAPEAFDGFAYDRYLARFHIYATCAYPEIELLAHQSGNRLLAPLLAARQATGRQVQQFLPEPYAALLNALLIGERQLIPAEILDQFSQTGISHIIAISGSHIVLVVSMLLAACLWLGLWRQQAFWVVSGILAAYITLLGFPASALRAAIMGWLLLVARQVQRLPNPTNALLLAAGGMLLHNPLLLRDDVGFQLSFAAVLGIGIFSDRFAPLVQWLPNRWQLRQIAQMSLAAQLATLPLVVWHFGILSVIAMLSNLAILPVLPYLMLVGFAAVIGSFLLPAFGAWLFFPVWILLEYLLRITHFFASLPWGAWQLS